MANQAKIDPALVARTCALFGVRKAARVITQLYDAALEPSGVRATQISVLVALAVRERMSLSQAAKALFMDRTTLTRNLRPLERSGWVRNERGDDRRERYLSLTRAGRAALDRALPHWQTAQTRVLEHLGAGRLNALLGELDGLVGAARGHAGNAPGADD